MPYPVFIPTTVRGDDFNRSNEDPVNAGKWSLFGGAGLAGGLKVVSNQAKAHSASFNGSYLIDYDYTAIEIQATIATQDSTISKVLKTRLAPAVAGTTPIPDPAQNGYQLSLDEVNSNEWLIARIDNGVGTVLATTSATALASGDVMAFQSIGSIHTAYRQVGGAGAWTQIAQAFDGTYRVGKPGIVVASDVVIFDDVKVAGIIYGQLNPSFASLPPSQGI